MGVWGKTGETSVDPHKKKEWAKRTGWDGNVTGEEEGGGQLLGGHEKKKPGPQEKGQWLSYIGKGV